jgi:hypothetical protein
MFGSMGSNACIFLTVLYSVLDLEWLVPTRPSEFLEAVDIWSDGQQCPAR